MNRGNDNTFWASVGEEVYLSCKPFRDQLYVHVRRYDGKFPTKTGVGIGLSRWKTLNEHFDEVNRHLDVQTRFDRHLGGNYYVTVDNDVVDLRKWWMADDGVLKPSYKGITLSKDQWSRLLQQSVELNKLLVEELDSVVKCIHQDQEGFFACRECCPDGLLK